MGSGVLKMCPKKVRSLLTLPTAATIALTVAVASALFLCMPPAPTQRILNTCSVKKE